MKKYAVVKLNHGCIVVCRSKRHAEVVASRKYENFRTRVARKFMATHGTVVPLEAYFIPSLLVQDVFKKYNDRVVDLNDLLKHIESYIKVLELEEAPKRYITWLKKLMKRLTQASGKRKKLKRKKKRKVSYPRTAVIHDFIRYSRGREYYVPKPQEIKFCKFLKLFLAVFKKTVWFGKIIPFTFDASVMILPRDRLLEYLDYVLELEDYVDCILKSKLISREVKDIIVSLIGD